MRQSSPIFVAGVGNNASTSVAMLAQQIGLGLIQAALSTMVWILAVIWLDLTADTRLDTTVITAIGMFVGILTLLLVTASKAIELRR